MYLPSNVIAPNTSECATALRPKPFAASTQCRLLVSSAFRLLTKLLASTGYNNLDFDFFLVLARHSRIETQHVVLLCEFLQRLCLSDALHARLAS